MMWHKREHISMDRNIAYPPVVIAARRRGGITETTRVRGVVRRGLGVFWGSIYSRCDCIRKDTDNEREIIGTRNILTWIPNAF